MATKPPAKTISEKARNVLNFIIQYRKRNGDSPTLRQISESLFHTSNQSIAQFHVRKLVQFGLLKASSKRHRCWIPSTLYNPEAALHKCLAHAQAGDLPAVIKEIEDFFREPIGPAAAEQPPECAAAAGGTDEPAPAPAGSSEGPDPAETPDSRSE